MLLRFSTKFSLIFFLIFFGSSIAFSAEKSDDKKGFDVNEMIMHHIKDSHEFHIMDINGHGVSFPLPIILWTKNGLSPQAATCFSGASGSPISLKKPRRCRCPRPLEDDRSWTVASSK